MNKVLALLATAIFMLASSIVAAESSCGVTPYVGADAEWRHLDFKKGFGNNLFRHDYPQGNIYAGIKINEYVGIEGGYEATARKTKASSLVGGDLSAGVLIPAGNTLQYYSTGQIKGPHINLMGYLPLCDRLQLIAMVGSAHLKANFVRTLITVNGAAATTTTPNTIFLSKKHILRLGGGIQHMIAEHFGIRAMLKWENTNKFRRVQDVLGNTSSLALRNSLIYSLGAFVTF